MVKKITKEKKYIINSIKKRDNTIVPFDENKIIKAIFKSVKAVGGEDIDEVKRLTSIIVNKIQEKLTENENPNVELVQNMVEKVLIEEGHAKTAKTYIIYRHKHDEMRKIKEMLGVTDELKLPVNTVKVLASRYLIKNNEGKIIETTKELFERVSNAIASGDKLYGKSNEEITKISKKFYNMMISSEFLPNSPTLMNAGTKLGQLSACFVLPVGDSLEEIFDSIKHQALIHKTGGGTGFSFSRLRPSGDHVAGTFGVSSCLCL